MLIAAHLVWALVAILLFRTLRAPAAFWAALVGGWVLLPPASYDPALSPDVFPYWIVGSGLPSGQLVTKLWTAPAIALAASLLFDRARWRSLAWRSYDGLLAAFCIWPLAEGALVERVDPAPVVASLYLAAAWGLPWIAGRLYLRDRDDLRAFAAMLALSAAALLPLALLEGLTPLRVHALVYGANPFALDGIERYIGYRPQIFFEHGNQYGLWCAGATLAAVWSWRDAADTARARYRGALALLLAGLTLAAQSVGAILLLAACLLLLAAPRAFAAFRLALPLGLAAALGLAALHVSGVVPVRSLVMETSAGRALLDGLRATGRGSAAWRVSQDLKTLPLLQGTLVAGTGRWDWFEPAKTRPWGLPLLVLGQFGLVGAAALGGAFAAALLRHARRAANSEGDRLLALLVLLFAADALFNSFLFYPAIAAAGAALAAERTQRRPAEAPPPGGG